MARFKFFKHMVQSLFVLLIDCFLDGTATQHTSDMSEEHTASCWKHFLLVY